MSYSLISHTMKSNDGIDFTQVTTDPIDTNGANLIVLTASYYSLGGQSGIFDNQGNTYIQITTTTGAGGSGNSLYYCFNPNTNASHTFGANGATNYPSIGVQAWSGSVSSPLDQNNNGGSGNSTTVSPGNVTPTEDNELIVTGLTVNLNSVSSIDSGFTISDSINASTGVFSTGMAYLVQTSASSENPTWTYSSTADQGVATIATFKGTGIMPATTNAFFAKGV